MLAALFFTGLGVVLTVTGVWTYKHPRYVADFHEKQDAKGSVRGPEGARANDMKLFYTEVSGGLLALVGTMLTLLTGSTLL